MKRGGPRGRGNRPMQSHRPQQNQRHSQTGPMMTGHQGLKDIDMELQLLKRKREIIEQQQQMLSNSYRPRNDYEQPMFNESRQNRYDDYVHLYDDNLRDSNSYGGGGPSGRKRQHVPVWENELQSPKRFSGPSRGVKKAFGSRSGPQPNNPRSDFQRPQAPRFAAPKPFKPRPAPPKKKEFNPTKVTKPSTGAPPTKLGSYEPAERKKLVTAALESSPYKFRAPGPRSKDEWILRADREPSRQMNGRLELALGSIMKELRRANPDSEKVFLQPAAMRAMKKAVRDRIWTVMVGKTVTTMENIRAAYYEVYRSANDNEIIMKGRDAHKGNDFATIDSANPEVYFKKNIHKLMSVKLEEMIHKLEVMYTDKNLGPKKRRYNNAKVKLNKPTENDQLQTATTEPQTETTEIQTETPAIIQTDTTELQTATTELETETTELETEITDLETETTQLQAETTEPKADESQSEDVQPETDDTELKPEEAQLDADETVESIEVQVDEPKAEIPDSEIKTEESASTQKVSNVKPPKITDLINNDQYKAFDTLMNYKMVHLIKKFSPMILKAMEVDSMYRKTKANILNETKKRLLRTSSDTTEPGQKDPQDTSNKTPNEKRFLTPLHYVKILGKPGLPKRKAMESFFEQFKPKSIKKHKNIHNLLFVGFIEKESFDNILAADGTVIGRYTLDIKISERNDNRKKPNNTNTSVESVDDSKTELNESFTESIGNELDDQITDLLTSIRKSEEDASDVVADLTGAKNDEKKENGDQTSSEVNQVFDADEDVIEIKDDHEVVEIKDVPQGDEILIGNEDKKGPVEPLKTEVKEVKGTPTRNSARLATPGGIKTRRMSKLNE